jgi:hypothetical protein
MGVKIRHARLWSGRQRPEEEKSKKKAVVFPVKKNKKLEIVRLVPGLIDAQATAIANQITPDLVYIAEKIADAREVPKPRKKDKPLAVIRQEEKLTADRLALALEGEREAINDDGRVDILTKEYVIEVKSACNYKHAIGQAIVYSFHYPSKTPMIYLFGDNLEEYRYRAMYHCTRLSIEYRDSITGIERTWNDDRRDHYL